MRTKSFSRMTAIAVITGSAVALAACSSTAQPAPAQTLSPDMEAELTIWHYNEDAALSDLEPQIEQFQALYPNVTFDVVFVPEEQFANRIISSATTQSGPDIMWYNGAFTQTFADAGVIENLDDEWADFADADLFPDSVLQRAADDSIYGVQSYVNLNALWYNQAILDEFGLEPPATLDELESAMETITADGTYDGMLLPGAPGVPGEWISKALFTAYGVMDYADYGAPEVEEMFARVSGWVDDAYIDRATVPLAQAEAINQFTAGDTAFYVGGNWQLTQAEEAGVEFGVVPMPEGPGGPGVVYLGGQAEAVGAFAANKELAWAFLADTWLTREHGEMRLGLGSIPTRGDVLTEDADPRILAYAEAAQDGTPLSPDTASTLEIGNLWSGVLTGQTSPADGAEQAASVAEGVE